MLDLFLILLDLKSRFCNHIWTSASIIKLKTLRKFISYTLFVLNRILIHNIIDLNEKNYFTLYPKEFAKLRSDFNNFSIKNLTFKLNGYSDLETLLNGYGKTLTINEKTKDYNLTKLDNKGGFIYKMKSIIEYNSNNYTYKRI